MLADIAVHRQICAPSMVVALACSEFAFYLTGSQYMGGARTDSDWDFMVQDTPEVREFLKELGFSEDILSWHGYDLEPMHNNLTNAVVQHISASGQKVQVQLSKDVYLNRDVRDYIDKHLFAKHFEASREDRMELWNLVAELLSWCPKVKVDRRTCVK